jgi:hypothetical protein
MTDSEVSDHVRAANVLWTRRSARVWTLDLSMLTDAGATLARPEKATDRPAAAELALRREQQRSPMPIPAQRRVPAPPPAPAAPPVTAPPPGPEQPRPGLCERITRRR